MVLSDVSVKLLSEALGREVVANEDLSNSDDYIVSYILSYDESMENAFTISAIAENLGIKVNVYDDTGDGSGVIETNMEFVNKVSKYIRDRQKIKALGGPDTQELINMKFEDLKVFLSDLGRPSSEPLTEKEYLDRSYLMLNWLNMYQKL